MNAAAVDCVSFLGVASKERGTETIESVFDFSVGVIFNQPRPTRLVQVRFGHVFLVFFLMICFSVGWLD